MPVIKTDDEINDVRNEAVTRDAEGSRWPGMSYEQGVADALDWAMGDREDNPFAEE